MQRENRKLAAIVAADIAGYSRLIGQDEEGTLRALRTHRAELIDPLIEQYGGRIANTAGDSLLLEFPSAVDAVRCSIAVQEGMLESNREVDADRRIEFRIGINVGDVVAQGNDLLGDGVNIAARLQEIGEAGGVTVSAVVHDYLDAAAAALFDDLGERELKNIRRPVRTWQWRIVDTLPNSDVDVSQPVAGFEGRPAIAVLPFENMSGDPEQEYFADGIAEDILTRLAMWRLLPVIARNSSFIFKGRNVDIKEVGEVLGARYVLEGSVRKAANRLRITAQLIDAETGHHLWADRFDGALDDVFELQDEITDLVVAALEAVVGNAERKRARKQNPKNLSAWEICHRGCWHLNRLNKDHIVEAEKLLRQVIDIEPDFGFALSQLALTHVYKVFFGWNDDVDTELEKAKLFAQQARTADELEPISHTILSFVHMFAGDHAAARVAAQKAIDLNPSLPMAYHAMGAAVGLDGDPDKGIELFQQGQRLSPNDPNAQFRLGGIAGLHIAAQRYEQALVYAERVTQVAPDFPVGHLRKAVALVELGRSEEAKVALQEFLHYSPDATVQSALATLRFKRAEDIDRYANSLRKTGLPEQ